MSTGAGRTGAGDFDFLVGRWRVRHRRLNERLAACTEWSEFDGTCEMRKVLGGLGNVDENYLDLPGDPYHAVTLRSFDPKSRLWTIWWLDGRRPNALDVPLIGAFEKGVGTFHAEALFNGRPIRIRFFWTLPERDKPRWEQAFSVDGGASWETNWIMHFSRARS